MKNLLSQKKRKNLLNNKKERTVDIKRSKNAFLYSLYITAPIFLAIIGLVAFLFSFVSMMKGIENYYIGLLVVVIIVALYCLVVLPITNHYLFSINVDEDFITAKSGTLIRRVNAIKIASIKNVQINKQKLGKNLYFVVISTDSEVIKLKSLTKEDAESLAKVREDEKI